MDAVMRATRLHPDDIEAIASRLTDRCKQSPWLTAEEAAFYLRCPISRIRKLTMSRDLPCERDGRRVLYNREALDAYVRAGGAKSP